MEIVKNSVKYLLITLLVLVFTAPFWLKSVPTKYILPLAGKSDVVDKVVCNFSTKVGGESMNPLITPGSSVEINRCFEEKDLIEGIVILFNDGTNLRLGIIRHILPLNPVVYKVSDEKAPELFHDVIIKEIEGIVKNVDASKSKYRAKQETESFVLDRNEFLTDFYLAKIPRGGGIEASTVEKTDTFFKDKDKFCSVIIPKKRLTGVDTEIFNGKTQKIIPLGNDIVFSTSPSPNINCREFGSGQGMLSLNPGTYRYRFLMNHQVLEDIHFEVK